MEKKNIELIELSTNEMIETAGGEGFAYDVGYFITGHIRNNYQVLEFYYDWITG